MLSCFISISFDLSLLVFDINQKENVMSPKYNFTSHVQLVHDWIIANKPLLFRLNKSENDTNIFIAAGMFLNAGAALDFKTAEEYKIYITCTGTSSTESFLTIRILDKSVTTPYSVPGMVFNIKVKRGYKMCFDYKFSYMYA